MKLKDYFKNLSHQLSANYLAVFGFISSLFTILSIIPEVFNFQGFILYLIPILLVYQYTLVYLVCFLSLVPIIILFMFLLKPKYQVKTQIIMLLCLCFLAIIPSFSSYKFSVAYPAAVLTVLNIPFVIIVLLTYLILLIIDLSDKLKVKNQELVENKFYKKFICFFYWYFLITIPAAIVLIAAIIAYAAVYR